MIALWVHCAHGRTGSRLLRLPSKLREAPSNELTRRGKGRHFLVKSFKKIEKTTRTKTNPEVPIENCWKSVERLRRTLSVSLRPNWKSCRTRMLDATARASAKNCSSWSWWPHLTDAKQTTISTPISTHHYVSEKLMFSIHRDYRRRLISMRMTDLSRIRSARFRSSHSKAATSSMRRHTRRISQGMRIGNLASKSWTITYPPWKISTDRNSTIKIFTFRTWKGNWVISREK